MADKPNRIKIDTHRGKENTAFGKHSRVPFNIEDLDSRSLLILAFIDIDQFLDSKFKTKNIRRIIRLEDFSFTLGVSKNTVKKCLKELETKELITSTYKHSVGTSYISNIVKLHVKYQIITYSFISRQDLSHSVKAFILKVIMLGENRISNIRNVTALVKETSTPRRKVNEVLDSLLLQGYILDHPTEKSIQILDVSGIMLDSEEKLMLEHRQLREAISFYETNLPTFSEDDTEEISRLKSEVGRLLKKIEMIQNGKSKNHKKT
jgi:DNA-binding transcriptional regulator YhcF (GntR family)